MSRWYYIGNGSVFDYDMDFSEKIINYVEVGKKEDIDALYFYYRSAIISYWRKLEEIFDLDSFSLKDFVKTTIPYDYDYEERIITIFENIKQYIEPKKIHYKDLLDQKIEQLEINYLKLINNITDSGRFDFIREIFMIFMYISDLSCGDSPISRESLSEDIKNYYLFPLTNDTGWFSYNSYLYALSHNLHIMGFPSGISNYDGNYDCPSVFIGHDFEHLYDIKLVLDNPINRGVKSYEMSETYKLEMYYDFIMKNNYTSNEKEIFIFTLWYIIHEWRRPLDFSILDIKDLSVLFDKYTLYGIKLNSHLLHEAYEIALQYGSPSLLRNMSYVTKTLARGEKISDEKEDHYHATLALIYGLYHLKSLHF
jgi:hypothetical protein